MVDLHSNYLLPIKPYDLLPLYQTSSPEDTLPKRGSNPWIDGRRHGKPSPRCRVGRGMSCLEERGKEKPHLESTMV